MQEKELYCYIEAKRQYRRIKDYIEEFENVIGKPERITNEKIQNFYRGLVVELSEAERNIFATYDYLTSLEHYFSLSEWEIFKLRYIEGLNRASIAERVFYSETTVTRKIKAIKQKTLTIN